MKHTTSCHTPKMSQLNSVYIDIKPKQLPIIYRKEYNITFFNLERLHYFDAQKWGNIFQHLVEKNCISDKTVSTPNEISERDLLKVHTKEYIDSLKWSKTVAYIIEVLPVMFVPNILVQNKYLKPMRYQTGGSVLAGKLAIEHGWAINLGGGFHHCSANEGGGFCSYADISLLIKFITEAETFKVKKVMIIDLDAHQGNGHEKDFIEDENVYIFDMFNVQIYPRDHKVKRAIKHRVELYSGTEDKEYLEKLDIALTEIEKNEFKPDLIVYNAGTDILIDDPLGDLNVTDEGIIKRDEKVFAYAHKHKVPIVMLTSGGYLKKTAKIIADSILNLKANNLLTDSRKNVGP